jgi:uncharacterized OsmC-like protein
MSEVSMNVDYPRLSKAIETTIEELRDGTKSAERVRRVSLRVKEGLEGIVSNGEYAFGVDAAIDAGGDGKYARPMDYVLGGLLSCTQMWCLRFAAAKGFRLDDLELEAAGHFTWRGEYLDEVDSGLNAITLRYDIHASGVDQTMMYEMADTVARRCPVFATLRKAVRIDENVMLNGSSVGARQWIPGQAAAQI